MRKRIFTITIIAASIFVSASLITSAQDLQKRRLEKGTIKNAELYKELDGLVQQSSDPLSIFILLDKYDIVNEFLQRSLNEGEEIPAILFFNGVKNYNTHVLIDFETREQIMRLVEAESLLLLWIDDREKDIYQVDVNIQKEKTSFLQDVDKVLGMFGELSSGTRDVDAKRYFINAEYYHNIGPSPSEIELVIKQVAETNYDENVYTLGNFDNIIAIDNDKVYFYTQTKVLLKNVETRYFGISLGASAVSTNDQVFEVSPDNDKIVTVRNNADQALQGNGMFLFSFMPRVEEDFVPSYKFWESSFYEDFYKRFSINAGFKLSERPFDTLFLGLGFNLIGSLDIMFGYNWTYLPTGDSQVNIENVQLSNASELFPKSYQNGFFFGLAFKAAQFGKIF